MASSSTMRYVRPLKIENFVHTEYESLNEVQEQVLVKLLNHASESNTRFTREALRYIFSEVEDGQVTDITPGKAIDVLATFLNEMTAHQRQEHRISKAVLVRTLKVFPCPRPWC